MEPILIYTDGGARGNPGPAGIGVVFAREEIGGVKVIAKHKKYLGDNITNNQAEYQALVMALTLAHEEGYEDVKVHTDSELMAEQMRGRYKVKNEGLRPLFDIAYSLSKRFKKFSIVAIRREKNELADSLVNQAIDERGGRHA